VDTVQRSELVSGHIYFVVKLKYIDVVFTLMFQNLSSFVNLTMPCLLEKALRDCLPCLAGGGGLETALVI